MSRFLFGVAVGVAAVGAVALVRWLYSDLDPQEFTGLPAGKV